MNFFINQLCTIYKGSTLIIFFSIHQTKKILKWKKIHGLQMYWKTNCSDDGVTYPYSRKSAS
jgi:hypothetical protein